MRLIELSGVTKEEHPAEAFLEEQAKMQHQRSQLDRWSQQKHFLSSAHHRAAGTGALAERTRDPQPQASAVAAKLRAQGTQLVAIAVEHTLVAGPLEGSPSASQLRKSVNPVLSELAVAAAEIGVQVALVSKEYPPETVQSLADQLFVPAERYGVLIRCGGARAAVLKATTHHRGGNLPPQKMFSGDGKAVVVPGHVRAQQNCKQWNLESAIARLRQKGVTVSKASSIVIDADRSDVQSLQRHG